MFLMAPLIKKKRGGAELTKEEIAFFVRGFSLGEIPDYQASALLMAIYFQGMTDRETLFLTEEMLHSGTSVDFSHLACFKVDKHSTGGVGDKTSLILGPIVAACGLAVPMISGRGLGHTGGTLDKLESIPGFNTQIPLDQFRSLVAKHHICFIGQTKEICPADKKMYALRDVTGTVESLPLICASIMSKKLAEGIDGLVLDVKFGSGAFMKTQADAKKLAQNLMSIAQGAGKKVATLLTDMNQPLGAYAGNALEVQECVDILKGQSRVGNSGQDLYESTRSLSIELSAWMLYLGQQAPSIEECRTLATDSLKSGAAYAKFEELCHIHGGDLSGLPSPTPVAELRASRSGVIQSFDSERIGWLGVQIGAGRAKATDVIEPHAGFEFLVKVGDPVTAGDPILKIYGKHPSTRQLLAPLSECVAIDDKTVAKLPLIAETMV